MEGDRINSVIEKQAELAGVPPKQMREELMSQSPQRRFVTPGEVAAAVVFLASDKASAITGSDINVNTGFVMY